MRKNDDLLIEALLEANGYLKNELTKARELMANFCDMANIENSDGADTYHAARDFLGHQSAPSVTRRDPLALIIEAAYHCAWSLEEVHQAVAEAGLPELSDETLNNLIGEYSESVSAPAAKG